MDIFSTLWATLMRKLKDLLEATLTLTNKELGEPIKLPMGFLQSHQVRHVHGSECKMNDIYIYIYFNYIYEVFLFSHVDSPDPDS